MNDITFLYEVGCERQKKIKIRKNMKRKQHILCQLSCTKLYDCLQVELNP